jgi:hypothetical protein
VRLHGRRGQAAGGQQSAPEFLIEVWERLEQVQQYYKLYYDRKHHASEFAVGD